MVNKIIAVDFDGTLVENKYPEIGKPLRFICAALKDSDITDDVLASNSSTDHELFITTTSTIVDIIH